MIYSRLQASVEDGQCSCDICTGIKTESIVDDKLCVTAVMIFSILVGRVLFKKERRCLPAFFQRKTFSKKFIYFVFPFYVKCSPLLGRT